MVVDAQCEPLGKSHVKVLSPVLFHSILHLFFTFPNIFFGSFCMMNGAERDRRVKEFQLTERARPLSLLSLFTFVYGVFLYLLASRFLTPLRRSCLLAWHR
jgi:hypothetical protein